MEKGKLERLKSDFSLYVFVGYVALLITSYLLNFTTLFK